MIEIYPATGRKTINWAGGTSTELFVFPPDGNFATRDFDFRVSTATVEVEESDFTFFEGIMRHLMILKGTLQLTHVNRYEKLLKPYDVDTFSGEWETKSRGKVTDFNLMLKNGYSGKLEHLHLAANCSQILESGADWNFLYIAEGNCTVDDHRAAAGDLVKVPSDCRVTTVSKAEIIRIEMRRPAQKSVVR